MVVGAAGDDAEALLSDGSCEGLRVGYHLSLVVAEGWLHGFLEANGPGGDGVNKRTALRAWESKPVELLGVSGAAEHYARTRTTQRFVRGRGDKVGVRHRARMHACGDQSGDVRHIHEKQRVDGLGDFADAFKLNDAGVGAGSRDDHLRLV